MTNATDTNKTLGESMFAQCGYAQDAIVVAGVHHIGKTFVVLPIEFVRTFENFMPDL